MPKGAKNSNGETDGELRRRVAAIARYRMSGDIELMMRHFAPDVVVHCNCTKEGLFRPIVLAGRKAFAQNIRRIDAEYEPLDGEILDVLVERGKTVVRWRGRWRHHGTGCVYTFDMAHFLHWKGGLVVEMFEFLDHHGRQTLDRAAIVSFEELLTPKPRGLDRAEIERRAIALVSFPSHGPDVALLRQYCSPDIVCEYVGVRERIPHAGRHVGIEALANIIRANAVGYEQSSGEILEIVVDGGRVAVRRSVEWRHCGTGRRGSVELTDFVKFEHGLIVEVIEIRDSITLLEMQGDR